MDADLVRVRLAGIERLVVPDDCREGFPTHDSSLRARTALDDGELLRLQNERSRGGPKESTPSSRSALGYASPPWATSRRRLTASEARRVALAAQGFDRPRPAGRVDARHLRRVIRQLGLLQIDFVNVLLPAHYLVPFSRLGPYDRRRLHELVYRRASSPSSGRTRRRSCRWTSGRCSSIAPALHRVQPRGFEEFLAELPDFYDLVLEEVRERGPLVVDDLPEPDRADTPPPGRQVGLEPQAQAPVPRGPLRLRPAGGGRPAGQLRALATTSPSGSCPPSTSPAGSRPPRPSASCCAARPGRTASAAPAIWPTTGGCRSATPASGSPSWWRAASCARWRSRSWPKPAFLHPAARLPRRIDARALLSPFDPLVWCRPRIARLFGFEYVIEIYLPESKRRWGYYVLPFLLGDRFVARVDLKADRAAGRLLVPRGLDRDRRRAGGRGRRPGEPSSGTLAGWLDLEGIDVDRRGDLAGPLTTALADGRPGRVE